MLWNILQCIYESRIFELFYFIWGFQLYQLCLGMSGEMLQSQVDVMQFLFLPEQGCWHISCYCLGSLFHSGWFLSPMAGSAHQTLTAAFLLCSLLFWARFVLFRGCAGCSLSLSFLESFLVMWNCQASQQIEERWYNIAPCLGLSHLLLLG